MEMEPETLEQSGFIKKWLPLGILALAVMIVVIDTTLLNVSLSTIIRDLKTDVQSMQWVISAYSLMLAAFTITGGRLGDLLGRKKMFVAGAILFAVGSYLASISQSVGMLIWGESIIEGIGAALMMPATTSLIVSNYKGRDRAIAFGVWGGIAAAALAIGPLLGGYLTSHYSWRWGFRINVVVVIILFIGAFFVKESGNARKKLNLDWFGIILSAVGMFLIVFGIIEASQYGWFYAREIFMIGTLQVQLLGNLSISVLAFIWGMLFILFFIGWELYYEKKGKLPLVSLHLFDNKQFNAGLLTQTVISLGQSGTIFTVALFLQSVGNLDAFQTGLALIPMAITLFIASPLAAYLSKKITAKTLIMIGLGINMSALIWLYFAISPVATLWTVAPALGLYGIGLGFVVSQITNLTLSAVPLNEAGEASGINSTLRQVGQTLGSAVIGAVLLSVLSSTLIKNVRASAVIPEYLKAPVTQQITQANSSIEFGGIEKIQAGIPDASSKKELVTLADDAMTSANKIAMLVGAGIVLLGFLTASRLPNTKNITKSQNPGPAH